MDGRLTCVLALLLVVSGAAQAQEPDPTVNDSDYDTTAPANDTDYLDESTTTTTGDSSDPTVGDGDFDTSVPTQDEAYLDDEADASSASSTRGTPGATVLGLLAAIAVLALAVRRR